MKEMKAASHQNLKQRAFKVETKLSKFMRAVNIEKAKQKQLFRTAFKSTEYELRDIGPGCYYPTYKEIG